MDNKKSRLAIIAGAAEAAQYARKNWKATPSEIIKHVSSQMPEILNKIDEPLQRGEEKRVTMGAIAGAASAADYIKKNRESTPDEIISHVMSKVSGIISNMEESL